jgi:hypothetical protein
MTRRIIKFAAAVAPAALLLAAGAPAQAKVLVMGDGGWEVSFDGSINAFLVFGEPDDPPAAPSGTRAGTAGTPAGLGLRDDLDSARVRTGLLPTVWGMNVKAPTTGGLDMAARIGLYPNISNNQKNTGVLNTADLDMREIFFTVDGAWGQLLAGKTLSQFMGKNILTDMTLFGVGGLGGVTKAGGTTLGRIGLGYVYPQFNARIQYTTPDMSGFKVSVGAYDPSNINSISAGDSAISALETNTPRLEGEASYAGNFGGADVSAWINGLWQEAEFASGCGLSSCTGDVTAWGFGGGLQVTVPVGPGSLQLVGSGYTGEALGTTFPLDGIGVEAILDSTGKERENGSVRTTASSARPCTLSARARHWATATAKATLTRPRPTRANGSPWVMSKWNRSRCTPSCSGTTSTRTGASLPSTAGRKPSGSTARTRKSTSSPSAPSSSGNRVRHS